MNSTNENVKSHMPRRATSRVCIPDSVPGHFGYENNRDVKEQRALGGAVFPTQPVKVVNPVFCIDNHKPNMMYYNEREESTRRSGERQVLGLTNNRNPCLTRTVSTSAPRYIREVNKVTVKVPDHKEPPKPKKKRDRNYFGKPKKDKSRKIDDPKNDFGRKCLETPKSEIAVNSIDHNRVRELDILSTFGSVVKDCEYLGLDTCDEVIDRSLDDDLFDVDGELEYCVEVRYYAREEVALKDIFEKDEEEDSFFVRGDLVDGEEEELSEEDLKLFEKLERLALERLKKCSLDTIEEEDSADELQFHSTLEVITKDEDEDVTDINAMYYKMLCCKEIDRLGDSIMEKLCLFRVDSLTELYEEDERKRLKQEQDDIRARIEEINWSLGIFDQVSTVARKEKKKLKRRLRRLRNLQNPEWRRKRNIKRSERRSKKRRAIGLISPEEAKAVMDFHGSFMDRQMRSWGSSFGSGVAGELSKDLKEAVKEGFEALVEKGSNIIDMLGQMFTYEGFSKLVSYLGAKALGLLGALRKVLGNFCMDWLKDLTLGTVLCLALAAAVYFFRDSIYKAAKSMLDKLLKLIGYEHIPTLDLSSVFDCSDSSSSGFSFQAYKEESSPWWSVLAIAVSAFVNSHLGWTLNSILKIIRDATSFVRSFAFGGKTLLDIVKSFVGMLFPQPTMSDYQDEFTEIESNIRVTRNIEALEKLDRFIDRVYKADLPPHFINSMANKATELRTELGRSWNASAGLRPEPVGFYLFGASGVGKTHALTRDVFPTLFKKMMEDKYMSEKVFPPARLAPSVETLWNEFIWSWNVAAEHMDGYRGQPAVLIDDINNVADKETIGKTMQTLVTAISVAEHNCNMAHLSGKGNVFFHSLLVAATSNAYDPAMASSGGQSVQPEAIRRRFLCYEAQVPEIFLYEEVLKKFIDNYKGKEWDDQVLTRLQYKGGSSMNPFLVDRFKAAFPDVDVDSFRVRYRRYYIVNDKMEYGAYSAITPAEMCELLWQKIKANMLRADEARLITCVDNRPNSEVKVRPGDKIIKSLKEGAESVWCKFDDSLDLNGKVRLFSTTYGSFIAKIYDGKEFLGKHVEGLWKKIATKTAALNHQFRAAVADSSPYRKLVNYFDLELAAFDFHADVFDKNRSVVIEMVDVVGLVEDYTLPDRVHPLASVDEINVAIDAALNEIDGSHKPRAKSWFSALDSNVVDKCKDEFKKKLEQVKKISNFHKALLCIVGATLTAGSLYLALKAVHNMWTAKEDVMELQASSNENIENAFNKIDKHVFLVTVIKPNRSVRNLGVCIRVGNRTFAMPKHYLALHMNTEDTIKLTRLYDGKHESYEWDPFDKAFAEHAYWQDKDTEEIMFLKAPNHVTIIPFTNENKPFKFADMFVSESQLQKMAVTTNIARMTADVIMKLYHPTDKPYEVQLKNVSLVKTPVEMSSHPRLGEYYSTKGIDVYRFQYNCKEGNCGSPLLIDSSQANASPIFALHVAGKAGRSDGGAASITRELVLRALSALKDSGSSVVIGGAKPDKTEMPGGKLAFMSMNLDGVEVPVPRGVITSECHSRKRLNPAAVPVLKEFGIKMDTLANCRRKEREGQEVDGATLVVPYLSSRVKTCACGADCKDPKHETNPFEVHQRISDQRKGVDPKMAGFCATIAQEVNRRLMLPGCIPLYPMSVEDVVKGEVNLGPLKNSSNGVDVETRRKMEQFRADPAWVKQCEQLYDLYGDFALSWPIKCFLKDEPVKYSKVKEGRLRVICANNPRVKIVERSMLGPFILSISQNQIYGYKGFANCLNPVTKGPEIVAYLCEVADEDDFSFLDIDIKGQDVNLSSFMTNSYIDFVLTKYGPECRDRLLNFLTSRHASFNCYPDNGEMKYSWRFDDIGSGKYDTSVENTYCAILMAHCAVFIALYIKDQILDVFDHIRVIACGDDVFMSVSSKVSSLITAAEIAKAYDFLGMKATPGDKESDQNYKKLSSCVFLKRNYGRVVGPSGSLEVAGALNKSSIMKRFAFTTEGVSNHALHLVHGALMEASRHGFEEFKQLHRAISMMSDVKGVLPPCSRSLWIDAWESTKLVDYEDDQSKPFTGFFGLLKGKYYNMIEQSSVRVTAAESAEVFEATQKASPASGGFYSFHAIDEGMANTDFQETVAPVVPQQEEKFFKTDFLDYSSVDAPSIISFLRRPLSVFETNFPAGVPVRRHCTLPCLGMIHQSQMWREKLHGIAWWSATAVFTVVVNAPPTVGGRLALVYDQRNTGLEVDRIFKSDKLWHITQRPHVQLDYQNKTAQMKIPYNSSMNGYHLAGYDFNVDEETFLNRRYYGDSGSVSLWNLVPNVVALGAPPVHVAVYVHYEDVRLGPPSGCKVSSVMPYTYYSEVPLSFDKGAILDFHAVTDKESPKFKFSSVLSTGAKISSWVSKAVPTLSAYTEPLSAVLGVAGNTMAHFGFSKVMNNTSFSTYFNAPQRYLFAANGGDFSIPLTMDVDNCVVVHGGSTAVDVDEMSIAFIAGRKTMVSSFTWLSSSPASTEVAQGLVSPLFKGNSGPSPIIVDHVIDEPLAIDQTATTHEGSPCAILALMHRFWRGDCVYTFNAVKTKFHTGRLMVTWDPWHCKEENFAQMQQYNNKVIWDLSESDELVVKIPFLACSQWCSGDVVDASTDIHSPRSIGHIRVYVLNPLVAPDNVSANIPILVSFHMENAEFAVPYENIGPVYGSITGELPGEGPRKLDFHAIWEQEVAQGGYIGDTQPSGSSAASALTIGESIHSLKQLALLPYRFYEWRPALRNEIRFIENTITAADDVTLTNFGIGDPLNSLAFSTLDTIMSAFSFKRGGFRWFVNMSKENMDVPDAYLDATLITTTLSNGSSPITLLETTNQTCRQKKRTVRLTQDTPLRTAQYTATLSMPTILINNPGNFSDLEADSFKESAAALTGDLTPMIAFQSPPGVGAQGDYRVVFQRMAADDFQLHGFRGWYKVVVRT